MSHDTLRWKSICALLFALKMFDMKSYQHSHRVAELLSDFPKYRSMSSVLIDQAHSIGLLHDVGKLGIPKHILTKPGYLNTREYQIIKRHPAIGMGILETVGLNELVPITLHHHERYDGMGYPHGLSGNTIPILSRMLALCDAYDAMTNDRPYSPPFSAKAALLEIENMSGSQFDPSLCLSFTQFIRKNERILD